VAVKNGAAGPEILTSLAEEVLPTLVARLERSRLGELEVRQDGWRVRLRRSPAPLGGAGDIATPTTRRAERKPDRPTSDGQADSRPQPLRPADRHSEVASPAVGYYTPREGLGVGGSVRAGDVIGHVDVLGVRQEVVAVDDGVIATLEAQPGEAVEYGQPVARIERVEQRS
jgi:acetyl-CoA carboxylase biotin carboxyl carrier protein